MNIVNQVCTRPQATELFKKGIATEGYFYWIKFQMPQEWVICSTGNLPHNVIAKCADDEILSAFTVAELGAMLQKEVKECYFHQPSGMWSHAHAGWRLDAEEKQLLFSTQAESYADHLLYLLNNYPVKWSADFVNNRLKKFAVPVPV